MNFSKNNKNVLERCIKYCTILDKKVFINRMVALIVILTVSFGFSQTTYVPDDDFEQALIDMSYDDVLDDYVETANISGITNLNVASRGIADLTGISDFVSLTGLNCSANLLTVLDLSQNINLEFLFCQSNQLSNLNMSNNTSIEVLDCRSNQLLTLDVSQLANMTSLKCSNNPISNLDVTQNTALLQLECSGNGMSSLDVTQNPLLNYLLCSGNAFTELNLSQNSMLAHLNTNNCFSLATMDLSQNTSLTLLSCVNNQLTSLDLSQMTGLTYLNCNVNQLTSLNVRNGNNTNVTYFYAANNANLTCIEVDDEIYATSNWLDIDPQTSFSEDCSTLSISDIEQNESVMIYPNPTSEFINIIAPNQVESIDVFNLFGKRVQHLINTNRIDVSLLHSGVYLVKVETNKGQLTKKVVVR